MHNHPVTHQQLDHWRAIRPRRVAAQRFSEQWIAECGVPPIQADIARALGLAVGTIPSLMKPRYQPVTRRKRADQFLTYVKEAPRPVDARRIAQAERWFSE